MTKPRLGFQLSGWWPRAAALKVKPAPRKDEARARFDAEVQKGVDAAVQGKVKDADEVFDRLSAKYRAMSKRRG